jgi:hypothetical protein
MTSTQHKQFEGRDFVDAEVYARVRKSFQEWYAKAQIPPTHPTQCSLSGVYGPRTTLHLPYFRK